MGAGSAKVGAGGTVVVAGEGVSAGAASSVGAFIGRGLRAIGRGMEGLISGLVRGVSGDSMRTFITAGVLGGLSDCLWRSPYTISACAAITIPRQMWETRCGTVPEQVERDTVAIG